MLVYSPPHTLAFINSKVTITGSRSNEQKAAPHLTVCYLPIFLYRDLGLSSKSTSDLVKYVVSHIFVFCCRITLVPYLCPFVQSDSFCLSSLTYLSLTPCASLLTSLSLTAYTTVPQPLIPVPQPLHPCPSPLMSLSLTLTSLSLTPYIPVPHPS